MISMLTGIVSYVEDESLTLNIGGVGYEVFSPSQFESASLVGQKVTFFIFTYVKEEALNLFGFLSMEEKKFFCQLLKVNGIGAKMALKIMMNESYQKIASNIRRGDVKSLLKLPKVGKKTAELMVLTLKDKVEAYENTNDFSDLPKNNDLISVLVNLGYGQSVVEKVVKNIDFELGFEESVKEGLKLLSSRP